MDIYVINKDFDICGVIDSYTSLIWTTRYYSAGDFELYVGATPELVALLQSGFYLCREGDLYADECRNVMIVKNIHITTDEENGDFLTVTGRSLKSIVGQRIVQEQTNINGYVETGIRKVITQNIVSPADAARKIDSFVLDDARGYTDTMRMQVTGDNVAEWLEKVCTTYGIGWDVYIKNKQFAFQLFRGVDRSYNQDVNPFVVFSDEFDNLLTSDYQSSMENYRNVAHVAGEGEGLDRRTVNVYSGTAEPAGLDRYEVYVDSRNTSSNGGEITAAEYLATLEEEGREALAEATITESFEGEVEPSANYILNVDYYLGDIVQVVNKYGISTAPRITEIIDSVDTEGRKVIPTFSTWEV